MRELKLAARAKINLTLDVLNRRADGYHEVAMLMQSIDLADTIYLSEATKLTLETNDSCLPTDIHNLAYQAAVLLQQEYNINRGAHIRLIKRIPVAAGLAGGSTDAAAVLKGLTTLWDLALTESDLSRLAACLGSDVPFCLRGGTALATGRGEQLTQLPDLPSRWLVLVKLPLEVSTASVYQAYRETDSLVHPDTTLAVAAINQGAWGKLDYNLVNVLESVTIKQHPEIGDLKQALLAAGADAVLMSGSGPSVFALAADESAAHTIARRLQPLAADIIVTNTAAQTSMLTDYEERSI